MDVNATLAELRSLKSQLLLSVEDLARIVELIEALDNWLTTGGFLPKAWTNPDAQILAVVKEHWITIESALGDAHAYRVDGGSGEPSDIAAAKEYKAAAESLGMSPHY